MARRSKTRSFTVFLSEGVLVAGIGWYAWNTPTGRLWMTYGGATVAAFVLLVGWLRLRSRRRRTTSFKKMVALDPYEFEHAVADILRRCGWKKVAVSGGAGDLQADVTGITPDRRYAVVQCKHHVEGINGTAKKVGSPVIQSILGARAIHDADVLVVATSSTFTRPAEDLAADHDVVLLGGDDLIEAGRSRRIDLPAPARR